MRRLSIFALSFAALAGAPGNAAEDRGHQSAICSRIADAITLLAPEMEKATGPVRTAFGTALLVLGREQVGQSCVFGPPVPIDLGLTGQRS